MADSLSPGPSSPAAPDHIRADLACLGCGYNLRGLSREGVCPECGTPVGRSQYGNRLRFCNPEWVGQLASGMNWLATAIIAGTLISCLAGGVAAAAKAPSRGDPFRVLVGVLIALLNLIAYLKVTTPDPSQREETFTARKVVRFMAIVGFAFGIIDVGGRHVYFGTLTPVVSVISGLMGVVSSFATFAYARQLALRIPDLSLASRTRTVMWGFCICTALTVIGGLVLAGFATSMAAARAARLATATAPVTTAPLTRTVVVPPAASPITFVLMFGGLTACVFAIGTLFFSIWAIILVFRYRTALNREAALAAAGWTQADKTNGDATPY